MKEFTCVICKKKFTGYGNNPYPLASKGRCCDDCDNLVVASRLDMHFTGATVKDVRQKYLGGK